MHGLYGWEGLDCVGFVYKIVEITAASSDDREAECLGSCVWGGIERAQILLYTLTFFPI